MLLEHRQWIDAKLQNGLFDSKGLTKSNDACCDTWRSLSDLKMLLAARIWQIGILLSTSIESLKTI